MNKNSIFLKLNVIFLISIISISLVFGVSMVFVKEKYKLNMFAKYMRIHEMVIFLSRHGYHKAIDDFLQKENIKIITKDMQKILKHSSEIKLNMPVFMKYLRNKHSIGRRAKLQKYLKIYTYNNNTYIHTQSKFHNMVLKINNTEKNIFAMIFLVSIGFLIVVLVVLYLIFRKDLLKIKIIENAMEQYRNNIIDKNLQNTGKDEISRLSNKFYNIIVKLDSIEESRKLFLRNVLHELKTPLTKARFYTQLLNSDEKENIEKHKENIEKTLIRIETLINEMANIEEVVAKKKIIEKKEYKLIDIIDSCIDSLFIDKDSIFINLKNISVNVDFKLFSIALKNLIDNGIKYSSNKKVYIEYVDNIISVSSTGDKLPFELSSYIEPFFKGNLSKTNQGGFGLGLYIVSEIVKKHNFSFKYKYINNKNVFIIDCNFVK